MSIEIPVPAMYADHHVVEVRRILFEISGVETINASAAFQLVEIGYDAEKTSEDELRRVLAEAGYLDGLPVPAESGEPAVGRDGTTYFRHTAAVETVRDVISFGQEIDPPRRPLWPCPGMEPHARTDEGGSDHGG